MSADLRARIAAALAAWWYTVTGVPELPKLMSQHREAVEQNWAARADAVMAVVQPELDAKDAEIARLAIGHRSLNQASIEALERAEQAEADLARSKDVAIREAEQVRSERNRYAERAEQAEDEVKRLTDLNAQYADRAIENGQRAEQAEAEVERLKAERAGWRSMAGVAEVEAERDRLKAMNAKLKATIDAFPDANSAANLAHARRERNRLRAAAERVRAMAQDWAKLADADDWGESMHDTAVADAGRAVLAALDRAPAAEQDGGGR